MKARIFPTSVRLSDDLKTQLRDAAEKAGHSVTIEIRLRLGRSFDLDEMADLVRKAMGK